MVPVWIETAAAIFSAKRANDSKTQEKQTQQTVPTDVSAPATPAKDGAGTFTVIGIALVLFLIGVILFITVLILI